MLQLESIFSHLCSSPRCFMVHGEPLPLCHRCLGLYVGASLTLIAWLALRIHQRGLPPWHVLLAQLAILSLATLGGLHIIDTGPAWRFVCGLWTGHTAIAWMLCASNSLTSSPPWTRRQAGGAWLVIAALCALAAASPFISRTPRLIWLLLALTGIAAILIAAAHAVTRVFRVIAMRAK